MAGEDLHVDSVGDDLAGLGKSGELLLGVLGEAELSADSDLLSAGELHHGSSEGLLGDLDVLEVASDGHEDGSNVDSGGSAVRLAVGLSHSLLKSIGSSAGKHLVDSENVPGVDSHSHVEVVFTGLVGHELVGSNSGGFESFRCDLFLLSGYEMDAVGEVVEHSLLVSDIVDSKLRIGDSSVVSGLGVWLVLLVSVAAGWSSSHFD